MGLSKRFLAPALVVLQLAGCATVVSELSVRNAPSQGGTGEGYRIARTLGSLQGRSPYVDRSDTFLRPMPLSAHGATIILVADGDRDAAPGSSNFMSFVVNQSARVYVAHDTRITLKPAWLRNSFLDTGKQMRIGSISLELYSNVYPEPRVRGTRQQSRGGRQRPECNVFSHRRAHGSRSRAAHGARLVASQLRNGGSGRAALDCIDG